MILPNMNYPDIVTQINEDYCEVLDRIRKSETKINKEILRRTVFPFSFNTIHYTTRNNNKWVITVKVYSRSKLHDRKIYAYCIMESSWGHFILRPSFSFDGQNSYIHMYSPHFFSRYRERHNVNLNGLELVEYYFSENKDYRVVRKPCETGSIYKEEICASTTDGVSLGQTPDGLNFIFRTFITYEMLKGEQIETFNLSNKIRKEMQEEYQPTKAQMLCSNFYI